MRFKAEWGAPRGLSLETGLVPTEILRGVYPETVFRRRTQEYDPRFLLFFLLIRQKNTRPAGQSVFLV